MKPLHFFYFKRNLTMFLVFTLLLSVNQTIYSQDTKELNNHYNQYKGKVIDQNSKKPLVLATLSIRGTNITTVTNAEGKFLLKVPKNINESNVVISSLGYENKEISLRQLKASKNNIGLEVHITELSEINIETIKNASELVRETLKKKGENYFSDPTLMTAFYRETIKKRKKNISLSEAVVNIYKAPYKSQKRDKLKLYKSRKSSNYKKLDTLALKLQGGPFNTVYLDIMKYPEYIFTDGLLNDYVFRLDHSTKINNRLIYVINFEQKEDVKKPLYKGQLFIDAEKKILTSAIYSLNITDKKEAARILVRKKPTRADVWPKEVAYRVDYLEKNNKWYYGYSKLLLEFKVNWDYKLFNSVYSMVCEMAVTDWEKNINESVPKYKDRIKPSIIMIEKSIGFSDPNFWGAYNIIEPDKSINFAIKKIQKQLKKAKLKRTALAK
ncbi:carboxypeptidase-like regulatory domain-containing protein [Flavivirga eckloniae]|uniref:Carboxypeptidase-like regulatory domain-containing protein n=1 Tax=Flavivirga eckloniae TaxID=1803846 RepID=A0A2K9PQX6_9FLAO|nr:carboxypeptidase-like regulatory domain-containing protein [Flavivirga eckloniae]AUP78977.1 hypothetical protein C1H87_09800 [Flavivirga eckloniae]